MPKSRHVPSAGDSTDVIDTDVVDTKVVDTDVDGVAADGPDVTDDPAEVSLVKDPTPLDGQAFLAANRTNREKYRVEAERKAAREAAKADRKAGRRGASDDADDASDKVDAVGAADEADPAEMAVDRIPRKLEAGDRAATTGSRFRVGGSRKTFLVIAALAALVVALAVSTAWLAVAYRDAKSDNVAASSGFDPTTQSAVDAARKYAVELTSYDSANFADLDRRIEAVSTPKFAQSYIASSQDARRGSAQVKAVSSAKADNAAIMSVDEGKYVVLLTLDQTVTSPEIRKAKPDGILYQSRVKMTLVQSDDGRWLIDDFDVV